jgi:putative membrane protein
MIDIFQLAVGTVSSRPYVFAFLAVYLFAATCHVGWKKTAWFTLAGYLIAFVSEFSSINTGIPYGWYYYIRHPEIVELWVAGVPFFDSLSYVFLAYCSYTTAILIVSPIKTMKWDLIALETRSIRRSFSVLFLGSLLQVFLDIIIDPVALQGRRWFLGQIYGYREAGVHFGVPLSNYLGWLLVSAVIIGAFQIIDAIGGRKSSRAGMKPFPFRSLYGPVLYLSVLVFNLAITLMIGEKLMALVGILIYILPVSIVAVLLARRANRYSRDELSEHLLDYPQSVVSGKKAQT